MVSSPAGLNASAAEAVMAEPGFAGSQGAGRVALPVAERVERRRLRNGFAVEHGWKTGPCRVTGGRDEALAL